MKKAEELTRDDIKIPAYRSMDHVELDTLQRERLQYISMKLDGNYTAIYISKTGQVSVWTRTNINITEKVNQNLWYKSLQLYWKQEAWLFGEIWKQGVPCSSISTLLAEKQDVMFSAFQLGSMRCPVKASRYAAARNISWVPFAGQRGWTAAQCEEWYETNLKLYNPADGLVFFDACGRGVRWKPRRTIDLIYSGFEFGRTGKKYGNTVGKILLRTKEGVPVAKASGMSDAERKYILCNDEHLRGKVCEVRYWGVGAQGRLRHPQFIRFRTDKLAAECSYFQDPELETYWRKKRNG